MILLCIFIIGIQLTALFVVYRSWRAGREEKEIYEMLDKALDKAKQVIPDSRDLSKPQNDEKDLSWQPEDEKKREKIA